MTPEELSQTLNKAVTNAIDTVWQRRALNRRLDMQLESYWADKRDSSANPLVRCGAKYFSQNDEDGILLEILRRIGLSDGTSLELGVGNGLENNTLILLMLGWNVIWAGDTPLGFSIPDKCKNLRFIKKWITVDNCKDTILVDLQNANSEKIDLISIDLDGNDIYILEELLQSGSRPSIFIVEYNGKFPPPVKWRIKYDPAYSWDFSDYQGASIQEFTDVLKSAGYELVGCNVTGVNAFFVRSDHRTNSKMCQPIYRRSSFRPTITGFSKEVIGVPREQLRGFLGYPSEPQSNREGMAARKSETLPPSRGTTL